MAQRTDIELAELATELKDWAARVDPDTVEVESTEDLRAIADAADAARAAHAALVEAVAIARGRGRSWNRIAVPLGVSRQAARERFSRITEGAGPEGD
jgi:hypothetical protein